MKALWLLILLVGLTVINGWAIAVMWGWFMIPLGMSAISTSHAVGLGALVSIWCHEGVTDEELHPTQIIAAILRPFVALLIGLIAYHCM